jgi:hypothetical protein
VSAPSDASEGVSLRYRDGELMVRAKPSEVPPDQLAALRAHKAELLPLLEAFGEARVLIRPRTEPPHLALERTLRAHSIRRRGKKR